MPVTEPKPTAPGTKPVIKPKPKPQSSPLGSTIHQNTATDPYGAPIGNWYDNAKYPGLLRGELPSAYTTWLTRLPTASPDEWALIQAHGGSMQSLLWRAKQDQQDPNDTLNLMARIFGTSVFDAAKAGGGGRRGGGGGGSDPTKAIASAEAEIRNKAATLGRPLTDDEIHFMATAAVNESWSDAQLMDQLMLGDKITEPGARSVSIDQIKQMANQQLLNVSDTTAREWANRIVSGEMLPETVASIFQQQASAEFGWAADQINAGVKMRDILSPSRDVLAHELERAPETIDLMDDKWRKMVQATNPDGTQRAATITEVTRNARKDPGYFDTSAAARLGANTFQMLRNAFEGR
jgi:hypothetical protein